jgi:hypothetical protein
LELYFPAVTLLAKIRSSGGLAAWWEPAGVAAAGGCRDRLSLGFIGKTV